MQHSNDSGSRTRLILEKINNDIERYQMLPSGSPVVVGFSGGADSMTLLSVLASLRSSRNITVTAAHVNHGIRGAEADRDEAFCQSVCRQMDIPFRVLHADVPKLAKESGESEEACGRRVRYAFFRELAKELGSGQTRIATAHTLQDAAETFLFHLARGTGLNGLTGIQPVRGAIIRPLISCSRDEIEVYCRENGLDFVTDSTNADIHYARNRIRHNILPEFAGLNPGFLSNMGRCMELLRADEQYLDAQADGLLQKARRDRPGKAPSYDAGVLAEANPAVSSRTLQTLLTSACGTVPEYRHIAELQRMLRETGNGQLQIPSGTTVRIRSGVLEILAPEQRKPNEPAAFQYAVSLKSEETEAGPGSGPVFSIDLPYGKLTGTVYPNPYLGMTPLPNDKKDRSLLEKAVDYGKINSNFTIRSRLPGDRFRLRARGVTKTLKQLFTEAGIPQEDRSRIAVAEENGCIFWVEGFGPSEAAAVAPDTEQILVFTIARTPTDPDRNDE